MNWEIRQGDALARLREMPDESENCCVSSPPYFGLRDYGVEGQIGLEATPEAFIEKLVEVFREVRRVLRSDGTCWINIGDSYASGGTGGASSKSTLKNDGRKLIGARRQELALNAVAISRSVPVGLKPKDLIGVPWMVAFALRADGWWLRSDIIWAKPAPMPESVTDRPTRSHEHVFLLTKSACYVYDADAIREPFATDPRENYPARAEITGRGTQGSAAARGNDRYKSGGFPAAKAGRNKRDVWTINTQPTPDAHFATYPVALAETCILAGCPVGGLVLDPFAGAGTSGLAAIKHGRSFLGIELNPKYIEIANNRVGRHCPLLVEGVA